MPQFYLTLLPVSCNYHSVPSLYFSFLDPTHKCMSCTWPSIPIFTSLTIKTSSSAHVITDDSGWMVFQHLFTLSISVHVSPDGNLVCFHLCCSVSHSLNVQVSLHIISFLWTSSSFPYCEMLPVSFTWCLEFTIPAAACKSSCSFLQSLSSSMCMKSPQEARRGVISVGTGVTTVVIYGVGAENLTSVLRMCMCS